MRRWRYVPMVLVLGSLCIGVAPNPQEGAEANLYLWQGGGSYAFDGCDGRSETSFRETNIAVDYKDEYGRRWGLEVSQVSESEKGYSVFSGGTSYPFSLNRKAWLFHPYVDVERKYMTVGLGGGMGFEQWSWADTTLPNDSPSGFESPSPGTPPVFFSFYLRLGDRRHLYSDLSLFRGVPHHTGGYGQLGVGAHWSPRWNWWVGAGVGPYKKADWMLRTGVRLNEGFGLNLLARRGDKIDLGDMGRLRERAFAIGLIYHIKGEGRKVGE